MRTTRTDKIFLSLLATFMVSAMLSVKTPTVPVATTTDNQLSETTLTSSETSDSRASTILPTPVVTSVSRPDFTAIEDVHTKKNEFFSYMLPMIRQSNEVIRMDRRFLYSVRDELRLGLEVDSGVLNRLGELSKHYRIKPQSDLLQQVNNLLVKVDVVPESLVLAQSANESGWGTSRFAREANNFFGVWCFSPGCGLEPLSRDEGLIHEVASYASVQQSVDAYIRTINTHRAYAELRQIRAESRAGDEIISGVALAEGLVRYSARGLDYVREIQQMIRVNNLHEFNFS